MKSITKRVSDRVARKLTEKFPGLEYRTYYPDTNSYSDWVQLEESKTIDIVGPGGGLACRICLRQI